MRTQKIEKKYLRPKTFWDVDFNRIDTEQDRDFIVARVVQRGSDREIMYINALLGFSQIYKLLKNYKGVPDKVIGYYKTMIHVSSR